MFIKCNVTTSMFFDVFVCFFVEKSSKRRARKKQQQLFIMRIQEEESAMDFLRRVFNVKQTWKNQTNAALIQQGDDLKTQESMKLDGDDEDDEDEDNSCKYTDNKQEMKLLDTKFGSDQVHLKPLNSHLSVKDDLLEYLGHGAFSIVKKCHSEKHQTDFAIKIITLQDENQNSYVKKFLPRELELWGEISQVKHPNILNMVEKFSTADHLYIVMDFAENGDLSKLLMYGAMTEHKARTYFRGIINGICFMHSKGIAHRDIKPDNLLLTKHGNVKLTGKSFNYIAKYTGVQI